MKTTIRNSIGGLALWSAVILVVQPTNLRVQGTAFTYQGRLESGGAPASGSFDFRFAIFDAASGGALVAGPLTNAATAVSNGLFTVTLDFGPAAVPTRAARRPTPEDSRTRCGFAPGSTPPEADRSSFDEQNFMSRRAVCSFLQGTVRS